MKKNLLTLLAIGSFAIATGASAQTATHSANAGAKIATAISLSNTSDLQFGSIVANSAAGTVLLTAGGTRSVASGTIQLSTQGTAPTAAGFTATGEAGYTYTISLPSTITISSGLNTMSIGTLSNDASLTLTSGTDAFHVGGTLSVGANQASGDYTGTFDATVTYN